VLSYDMAFWLGTSPSRWRMLNCDDAALGVWLAALQNGRICKRDEK